jgi:hypothetical protein
LQYHQLKIDCLQMPSHPLASQANGAKQSAPPPTGGQQASSRPAAWGRGRGSRGGCSTLGLGEAARFRPVEARDVGEGRIQVEEARFRPEAARFRPAAELFRPAAALFQAAAARAGSGGCRFLRMKRIDRGRSLG